MELLGRYFKVRIEKEQLFGEKKVMFSDIMRLELGKEYEEIKDFKKLLKALDDIMDDYNRENPIKMNLVFFP